MRLLVSACLLGVPCRYDGGSKSCTQVLALAEEHQMIPFCPEVYGGLPTPRPPAERVGERVLTQAGADVTCAYARGAQAALDIFRLTGCQAALLKARSPSCGAGAIYDGGFQGRLIPGDGVTAALLKAQGIPVATEEDLSSLFAHLDPVP